MTPRAVKRGGKKVCVWSEDNLDGYWITGCKNAHEFMNDGIEENKYKFCPYCGKKIKEKR